MIILRVSKMRAYMLLPVFMRLTQHPDRLDADKNLKYGFNFIKV